MFVVKIPVFAGCTVFDCSLMLFIVVCNVSKIGPLISDMMPLWSAVFFFTAGVVLGEAWAGVDDQSESRWWLTLGKGSWVIPCRNIWSSLWLSCLLGNYTRWGSMVSLFWAKENIIHERNWSQYKLYGWCGGKSSTSRHACWRFLRYWKSCPDSPLVVGNRFYCCISATWKWNPRKVTLLSQ